MDVDDSPSTVGIVLKRNPDRVSLCILIVSLDALLLTVESHYYHYIRWMDSDRISSTHRINSS